MRPNRNEKVAFITPNPSRFDGHFLYQFSDSPKAFSIGGIAVDKREALVRLGIMPDNNVVTNKVIRALGRRTLAIIKAQDAASQSQVENAFSPVIADEVELRANWAMIDFLSALKPLEKLAGDQFRAMSRINGVKEVAGNLLDALSKKISAMFEGLADSGSASSNFIRDTQKTLEAIYRKVNQKLHAISMRAAQNAADYQEFHRDLLREIMQDFTELQKMISIEQRSFSNILSTGNGTATKACQKALYDIQNHDYSLEGCADDQLWRVEKREANQTQVLDTSQFSGMSKDDALFAACLLESKAKGDVLQTVKENVALAKQTIQKAHMALKLSFDEKRYQAANRGRFQWWRKIKAKLGLFRDSEFATKQKIDRLVGKHEEDSLGSVVPAFNPAQPVEAYQSGDPFSAVTRLVYAFGEYVSQEMAMYPVKGAVGSAALSVMLPSALGLKCAPHILQGVCNVLSADGYLVKQQKLAHSVQAMNKAWIWLTGPQGPVEQVLMSYAESHVLMEVVNTVVSQFINGESDKILTEVQEIFFPEGINTQLTSDVLRQKTAGFAKFLILLCVFAGLGKVVSLLPNSHVVMSLAEQIDDLGDIDAEALGEFLTSKGASSASRAIEQLSNLAETVGVFVVKVLGVMHFMPQNPSKEMIEAHMYFIALEREFKDEEIPVRIKASDAFVRYRAVLQDCFDNNPALVSSGVYPQKFLACCGVEGGALKLHAAYHFLCGLRTKQAHEIKALQDDERFMAHKAVLEDYPDLLDPEEFSGKFLHDCGIDVGYSTAWLEGVLVGALQSDARTVSRMVRGTWSFLKAIPRNPVQKLVKLKQGVVRVVTAGWLLAKAVLQAGLGLAVNAVSASVSVVGGVLETIVGVIEQIARGEFLSMAKFLGSQSLKVLEAPVRVLQTVAQFAWTIPVALGSLAAAPFRGNKSMSAFSYVKENVKAMWGFFRKPAEKMRVAYKKFDEGMKDTSHPGLLGFKNGVRYVNQKFIESTSAIKHFFSDKLSWVRDKALRSDDQYLEKARYQDKRDARRMAENTLKEQVKRYRASFENKTVVQQVIVQDAVGTPINSSTSQAPVQQSVAAEAVDVTVDSGALPGDSVKEEEIDHETVSALLSLSCVCGQDRRESDCGYGDRPASTPSH